MSYIAKTNLANRANYGGSRSAASIQYLVIHYTANDGDHDESNANYFKRNIVKASAHYFVDDDSIMQSVPDNYIAWSVGGSKYATCIQSGGGKWYGKCTNMNSISIELCDTVKDGKSSFTEATMANAAELIKKLMTKYKISSDHVIRHFDVTGKPCPKPFLSSTEWEKFKARLTDCVYAYANRSNGLPLRDKPDVSGKCTVRIPAGKKVRILGRTKPGYWHVKVTLDGRVYKGYVNSKYLQI